MLVRGCALILESSFFSTSKMEKTVGSTNQLQNKDLLSSSFSCSASSDAYKSEGVVKKTGMSTIGYSSGGGCSDGDDCQFPILLTRNTYSTVILGLSLFGFSDTHVENRVMN